MYSVLTNHVLASCLWSLCWGCSLAGLNIARAQRKYSKGLADQSRLYGAWEKENFCFAQRELRPRSFKMLLALCTWFWLKSVWAKHTSDLSIWDVSARLAWDGTAQRGGGEGADLVGKQGGLAYVAASLSPQECLSIMHSPSLHFSCNLLVFHWVLRFFCGFFGFFSNL